jgi:uncharacterized protein (TIGR03437 family)
MKLVRLAALLWAATGWPAAAQTWDTSGNGMLNGTYYFREVIYFVSSTGLSEDALYGTIAFNGSAGTYSINCTVMDSYYGLGTCAQFALPTSGTYSISASGYGFLSSPISSTAKVYGLVSQQGIFVGSSTESGFNDLFIAAPLATPMPTNATFKGSYWLADMDTPNGISSMFQVNPDGAGNLGNVSLTGYVYNYGSTVVTQTAAAVKYSFSNGAAVVAFPSPSNATLIAGQKYLYISPDGNFVFGGSPTSWDFLVGVRTASGTPGFGGLYYQAGINLSSVFDTYYGSLNANAGMAVGHQRVNDVLDGYLYGYTYSEAYSLSSNGTYSIPSVMNYVVGADGVRIGSGIGPYLGINVALPAPGFSGSGVFINPAGVVNAASSAPFTAGIVPGDFITIYGSNLAPGIATAYTVPFPTTAGLDGVQVTVNGLPAPVQFVSPGQISAIVPYAIGSPSIARIQVVNNGVASNAVTEFVNLTAPGVFTVPPGGVGYGAVLHGDYSLVTAQNPAQVGETVSVYLTGLGTTNPLIQDGSAGVFSQTNNTIMVYIGGQAATVGYAGLAPQLAGLYQINVTVPSGVTTGDNSLEIVGPDSDAAEALIPVGSGLTTSASSAPQPAVRKLPKSAPPVGRPMPRLGPISPTSR